MRVLHKIQDLRGCFKLFAHIITDTRNRKYRFGEYINNAWGGENAVK